MYVNHLFILRTIIFKNFKYNSLSDTHYRMTSHTGYESK